MKTKRLLMAPFMGLMLTLIAWSTLNLNLFAQTAIIPQIVINEIMKHPATVNDFMGEWLELYNADSNPFDLNGCILRDDGTEAHIIDNGGPLIINPGAYLVLGNNGDPGTNGGVNIDYVYANFQLSNLNDEIILECAGVEVDRVEYDDGITFPDPSGASMQLLAPTLDNNLGTNWCEATSPWPGSDGDYGTPGRPTICLSITKNVIPDANVTFQGEVTYTVILGNDGGLETGNIDFTDTLPPEVDFTRWVDQPTGASVTNDQITWTGAVAAGQIITFTFVVNHVGDYEDLVTNVAEYSYLGHSSNAQASFTVEPEPFTGTVIINEIMKSPDVIPDDDGEWLELYNPGSIPVDINGCWLKDDDLDNHLIDNGGPLIINPGEYLVLGKSSDMALNGGVSVAYAYGKFGYFLHDGIDEVILECGGREVDRVNYDNGVTFPNPVGASMQLLAPLLDNNVGTNWCEAMTVWPGGNGDRGTPGAPNVCSANLALSKRVSSSLAAPGQSLAYTLIYTNNGPYLARGVLITDEVPTALINYTFSNSGATITPTGSLNYVWQVQDLAPGEGGIITVIGELSTPLARDFIFTNAAEIATTMFDGDQANNTGEAQTTVSNVPPQASNDTDNTAEDTPLTLALLANDSDLNGDNLTLATIGIPANGIATSNGNTAVYTPALNFNGTDSFIYIVSDDLLTDTAKVTIIVAPVNDVPEVVDDIAATLEDIPVLIDVLSNDADLDGNLVSASVNVFNGPNNGTVSVAGATGVVTYNPDPNFNGLDSFAYEVCDDGTPLPSQCATAIVTITVASVNDAPQAIGDMATTSENTPVVIAVLNNDSDVDGALVPASVTVIGGPGNGSASVNGVTGEITYTPDPGFSGSDSFIYEVCDDGAPLPAQCAAATVTITINVSAATGCAATPDDGITVYPAVQQAVDAASPSDTVKIAGYCAGVEARAGLVQTVYISQPLTIRGGYTVTDWVNSRPITQPTILDALTQGRVMVISGTGANVTIENLTVTQGTVSGVNLCPTSCGGGILATGPLTLTNVHIISNTAALDGGGAWANSGVIATTSHFEGNVSLGGSGGGVRAPLGELTFDNTTFIGNRALVDGGGAHSFDAILVGGRFEHNVAQRNGGGLRIDRRLTLIDTQFINNSAAGVGGGVVISQTFGGAGRLVNGLFARNHAGANGASLYLNTQRPVDILHATIASPTIVAGQAIYVAGGTANITNTIIASHTTGIEQAGSSSVNENYNLFFNTPTTTTAGVNSGGNSFVGNPAFLNPANNDYHLAVASAALDAGMEAGVTADFEGDVRPQGAGPDVGYDEFPFRPQADLGISKVANPSTAAPGERVTYTIVFSNPGLSTVTGVVITDIVPPYLTKLLVVASGVTITPTGSLTYVWQVRDLTSGVGGVITMTGELISPLPRGFVFTNTAQITTTTSDSQANNHSAVVTVTVANARPQAVNDSDNTNEDTAITLTVLGNDSDLNGDNLILTTVRNPANGTAIISGDAVIYMPALNFNGSDTFTYVVSDGLLTDTATITITVNAVNDPPDAFDDEDTTPEDTPVTIDVLTNDIDPEVDNLTIIAIGVPGQGVVSSDGKTVVYTPTLNFNGMDVFTYTISDGSSGFDTATVTTIVTAVNDPPVGVNDNYSTAEDTPLLISAEAGILSKDADIENDALTATLVSGVLTGTLILNLDGSFVYTPTLNFSGLVTFTYRAIDGLALSNLAMVTIVVSPINDPPQFISLADTAATVGLPYGYTSIATDVDVGDHLTLTALTLPTWLSLSDHGDGTATLEGVPTVADMGDHLVVLQVSDGQSSDTQSFTITVEVAGPTTTTLYLPVVIKSLPPTPPDLIVTELIATSNAVTVAIKNIGGSPVVDAFWVDVYIDPVEPPSLNVIWPAIAAQGLAWGITDPVPAGGELTLTVGGDYYFPTESDFSSLAPGTPVWTQVDSINLETAFGAVLESEERNNIFGPVNATARIGDVVIEAPTHTFSPTVKEGGLPARR